MRRQPAVLVVWFSCVALGTSLAACARRPGQPPRSSAIRQPAAAPLPSGPPQAKVVAGDIVPPGWTLEGEPGLLPLTPDGLSRWLLIADTALDLPSDGVRRRLRRFALVAAGGAGRWRAVRVTSVELSVGGADPWREERRDIDGDGQADLLVHYARHGQDQEPLRGFVGLASGSQELLAFSLVHVLAPGHAFSGDACWLRVQQRPVLLVDWTEYGGQSPTTLTAAYTVGAAGFQDTPLFGVVAAEAARPEALLAKLGENAAEEQSFAAAVEDCPLAPEGAAVLTAPGGFALASGWSFSKADAGAHWPRRLPKPLRPLPFETKSGQAFAWPNAD